MAWERLAHVVLGSDGDNFDTGTFTAKKNMKVIIRLKASSTTNRPCLRFNGDTGNNYADRYSGNGGSDGTGSSRSNIRAFGYNEANKDKYVVCNITNISDKEKLVISHGLDNGGDGAGNAPTRDESVGKLANTSASITSIQAFNDESGDFEAGSSITVLGAKEPATADTLTVSDLTAKKHLMIQAKTISDGQVTANYRFNADSGSNYARRQSSNGGSDGTGTSQNVILAGYGTSGETTFITTHVINEATKEKLVITELVTNGSGNGAGNAPNRREIVGKWANTSNAITSVTLFNNDTGSFAEGTEVTVYGTD